MAKMKQYIPTSAAAWAQARECSRLASLTTLPNIQSRFLRLRDSWIIVATELERIEGQKVAPSDEPTEEVIVPDGPSDSKTAH
jgi:hypothetical protein